MIYNVLIPKLKQASVTADHRPTFNLDYKLHAICKDLLCQLLLLLSVTSYQAEAMEGREDSFGCLVLELSVHWVGEVWPEQFLGTLSLWQSPRGQKEGEKAELEPWWG